MFRKHIYGGILTFSLNSFSARITIECQIASTAWNANASDRRIPFTDRYVNLLRYLNNTPPLSEPNRVEPVLFAAQERIVSRHECKFQNSRNEYRSRVIVARISISRNAYT